MEIKVIKNQNKITKDEIAIIAREQFGNVVKAVVDIEQEIMAVGGDLHTDEKILLLKQENSNPEHLWGINLYPEMNEKKWIEFDSIINLQHPSGLRGIDHPEVQEKIRNIVKKLVSD